MLAIDTIFVPQGAEYQAVCRGLQQAKNILVISIPIGVRQVDCVLSEYSEAIDKATGILIIGLCGGLNNIHAVGDAVTVEKCEDVEHRQINLDPELTTAVQQKLSLNLATALTSDRVIAQAREKLALAKQYSATVVEMEGYGYITALQSRGKRIAMLQIVSDDARGDIPDLNQAIDDLGSLKTLPMAISLIKQPLAAVNLIRGSLTGLKTLERTVDQLFTV